MCRVPAWDLSLFGRGPCFKYVRDPACKGEELLFSDQSCPSSGVRTYPSCEAVDCALLLFRMTTSSSSRQPMCEPFKPPSTFSIAKIRASDEPRLQTDDALCSEIPPCISVRARYTLSRLLGYEATRSANLTETSRMSSALTILLIHFSGIASYP